MRFPSFQSPLVLPLDLRNTYAKEIEEFLIEFKGNNLLHEHEINQLTRLHNYLQQPVVGPDLDRMRNDFKQFYTQYDQRRGKNFVDTFPALQEFYEQIP